MEIIGFVASVLVGISLGLIGSGGSILMVPILVYLFKIDVVTATTYSLLIVGFTSFIGSISYFTKGLVHQKIVLLFGIPSIISVFLTRNYVLPSIPESILNFGNFTLTKGLLLLLLFACLMIAASYSMLRKSTNESQQNDNASNKNIIPIVLQGLFVGFITGLIGAGGGFLIIPVLVHFLKLDIKQAIGTSLLIIALNSTFGFIISSTQFHFDWIFIVSILALSTLGVLIGNLLSKKIDGKKLKPAFGWFVLIMGIFIIVKELFLS
jgi:hypothetical protein